MFLLTYIQLSLPSFIILIRYWESLPVCCFASSESYFCSYQREAYAWQDITVYGPIQHTKQLHPSRSI